MADYLVTDTELTSIADAIRTKGGTSADLSFPTEFVSAINAIETGSQPTGTKYIYTDIDNLDDAFDVGDYQYCSIDFAPVKDGKLRMWIELTSADLTFKSPVNSMSPFETYTGKLNWGDGSPIVDFDYDTYNQIGTHTYPNAGRYCVEVWWTGGKETQNFYPATADRDKVIALEHYSKKKVDITCTKYLHNLRKLRYSGTVSTYIEFMQCYALTDVIIPDVATEIGCCGYNTSLEYLTIPASVTKIGNRGFYDNSNMKEYHFKSTNPPTITTSSTIEVFYNMPSTCKIYVPSASLNAYKSANVWSNYASQIYGE